MGDADRPWMELLEKEAWEAKKKKDVDKNKCAPHQHRNRKRSCPRLAPGLSCPRPTSPAQAVWVCFDQEFKRYPPRAKVLLNEQA